MSMVKYMDKYRYIGNSNKKIFLYPFLKMNFYFNEIYFIQKMIL